MDSQHLSQAPNEFHPIWQAGQKSNHHPRAWPLHSSEWHHFSQVIKRSCSSIYHAHRVTDLLCRDMLCPFFSMIRRIQLNSKCNPKYPRGTSPVHLLLDQLQFKGNTIKADRLQHTTQVGSTSESYFSWLFFWNGKTFVIWQNIGITIINFLTLLFKITSLHTKKTDAWIFEKNTNKMETT